MKTTTRLLSIVIVLALLAACRPTPTPSPTATPTSPTPSPTVTPTSLTQAGDTELLGYPLLLQYDLSGHILLQDISTGKVRYFKDDLRIFEPGYFVGWSQNGCAFLLFKDSDIVEVNLGGEIIRTVYKNKPFQYLGKTIPYPGVNLSPTETWITFMVGNGDQLGHPVSGVYYEQEELLIMPVDHHVSPIQITHRGGGLIAEWAPNSTKIAFSDYDENRYYQIYTSDIDGKNQIQQTHFTDQFWPVDIHWSPNSQNMVILVWDSVQQPVYLLASVTNNVELNLGQVSYFWWEDDSQLGIWNRHNIQWINPTNQEVTREISDAPEPDGYIQRLGTLDQFGCFLDCFDREGSGFYMYDTTLQEMVNYPNVQILPDYVTWFAAPKEFMGEALCH